MTRGKLIPDESHPITVTPTPGRVRVVVGETVIAESDSSLTLQEASYPPCSTCRWPTSIPPP